MNTLKIIGVAGLAVMLLGAQPAAAAPTEGAARAQAATAETPRADATRTVHAGTAQHALAGWLGSCYVSRYSTYAGGWCDGNGPDWTYQGTVRCGNNPGYINNGPTRWAGDRRGSYSSCPSGTSAARGGVDVFYQGSYQTSFLV
ncbi:hypothetical protein GCM10010112_93740 [Actinoplanes lobatus]|uniref:Uncharacterized protein n=1 Tax=Actinoplanes lobatus TaxID=113568 RepID=A0A7W7HKW4_9ACTN|nr:hypothetical protein [Actinoplanes lobatus]MBB4752335.1 hypothetical protein [Actinoplanes lobatus]GGN99714.1 hypothetical protein GCM10010112_93740 [Actinoplanes lobatus]GIE46420.1 hypothetical protein Alo02nite_93180 [Actinoplanes lobatus]